MVSQRPLPVVAAVEKLGAPEVTIVLPCLNEARTLGACIAEIRRTLREANIHGELLVADNGSNDGSPAIAQSQGCASCTCGPKDTEAP